MAEQTEKTYLTNRSLPCNSFVYEAASQREIEKEEIRQKILRQKELEEEVWRELAMERAFGTTQRSLDNHIGASQPSLIMPPPEIKHSAQIRNKDKVILLAKPDIGLYSAKRKAETHDVPGDEPSAISLNKKLKEEWSCELCRIKVTSENGLNDHLNGKKHKAREARKKREIDKHSKKSQNTVIKVTDTAVNTTVSEVDAEKDQKNPNCCIALEIMNENVVDTKSKNEEHVETMAGIGLNVTESKNDEQLVDTMMDNSVVESRDEEQLLEMVLDNGASVTESKNEKKLEEMTVDERVTESRNEKKLEEMMVDERVTEAKSEEQLLQTVFDNGASVTKSKNENKLEEMTVDERVTESKNEEQLLEAVLDNGVSVTESKKKKKLEEMTVDVRVTEAKNEEQLLETVLDNIAILTESKNEKKLEKMTVDERVTEAKNEEQLLETVLDNVAILTESKNEKLEEMTVDERVTEPKNEKKLEEMTVDERVTESKNEEQHVEKNQNVDFFESKKGTATEEAAKSAFTEMMKVRGLWCELCQIGTNSQVMMEGHIKGKKHIKKMNQKNASL